MLFAGEPYDAAAAEASFSGAGGPGGRAGAAWAVAGDGTADAGPAGGEDEGGDEAEAALPGPPGGQPGGAASGGARRRGAVELGVSAGPAPAAGAVTNYAQVGC